MDATPENDIDLADLEAQRTDPNVVTVPIICVGASAGGLEPIEKFVHALPMTSGCAIVVIQHLSPNHKSVMDELLGRQTGLAIRRVEDGMTIEPNTIYLIPARKEMIVSRGQLLLSDVDLSERQPSLPINVFLRSLAEEMGPRAVAVILSGTGRDGTIGACDVGDTGGLVLVEDPAGAAFPSMPASVLASVPQAIAMPPSEMPAYILGNMASGGGQALAAGEPVLVEPSQEATSRILEVLQRQFGIDFNLYKIGTVLRRVRRRAELAGINELAKFADLLAVDREELEQLYHDLLIAITGFFRDGEAFAALEKSAIPEIFKDWTGELPLRVWIAACASGEEAYSIAIMLHEYVRENDLPPNFTIFATDVHRRSLAIAARGLYSADRLEAMPQELRDRYFVRDEGAYRVRADLRRQVVFSAHDVLRDPPFTNMHLVSCRNLLIYFTAAAQRTALTRFDFALRKGGVLFLGASETLGDISGDFETIDARWKLFVKNRSRRPADLGLGDVRPMINASQSGRLAPPGDLSLKPMFETALGSLIGQGFLLDGNAKLLFVFGDAGRLLEFGRGVFRQRFVDMVPGAVRPAISSGLHRARLLGSRLVVRAVGREIGTTGWDDIEITPVGGKDLEPACFIVRTSPPDLPPVIEIPPLSSDSEAQRRISELEHDLQAMEESLQSSIEELQASNEELQASNEELQSTNEELHSVNEELHTVSAEHQQRVAELAQVTSDLQNLLDSLDAPIIFLDRHFRLRRFTDPANALFSLRMSDIGRPLLEVRTKFEADGLEQRMTEVLETGTTVEYDVNTQDGRVMLLRILAYRGQFENAGVVLFFVDTKMAARSEFELASGLAMIEPALEGHGLMVCKMRPHGPLLARNKLFADYFDIAAEGPSERDMFDLVPEGIADAFRAAIRQMTHEKPVAHLVAYDRRRDGSLLALRWVLRGLFDPDRGLQSVFATAADVASEAIARSRSRIIDSQDSVVSYSVDGSNRMIAVDEHWTRFTGQDPDEARDKGWLEAFDPADREMVDAWMEQVGSASLANPVALRIHHAPSGGYRWVRLGCDVITDSDGLAVQRIVAGIAGDAVS